MASDDIEPHVRFLGDLAKTTVRPGDVLVLRTDREISEDSSARMASRLSAFFPKNVCIVLDGGTELSIVSVHPGAGGDVHVVVKVVAPDGTAAEAAATSLVTPPSMARRG